MEIHFFKDACCLFLFFSLLFFTMSCGTREDAGPLSYQVCKKKELPDALSRLLDEKREKAFSLTYENAAFLYLAVGCGRQESEVYAVAIDQVRETETAIQVHFLLINPAHSEGRITGEPDPCPYIVLRCEKTEKRVLFVNQAHRYDIEHLGKWRDGTWNCKKEKSEPNG